MERIKDGERCYKMSSRIAAASLAATVKSVLPHPPKD